MINPAKGQEEEIRMSLEEREQTGPEERDLEAGETPNNGDGSTIDHAPEDEEDSLIEKSPEEDEAPDEEEAPEDGDTPTPGDAHDNSESGEVQGTGGTEGTGEEEANESDAAATGELKVVLHLREGRASAGVWQPGADVHLETFMETDMSILVAELPGLLARAQARWNENPMRPKYEPPKKAPTKKTSAKKTSAKNQQQPNQNQPTTETTEETQQTGMARLF